jgi:hypothetical protein
MDVFKVDPGWYEKYWLTEPPQPKQRTFAGHLGRFALALALLAGGGALLAQVHVDQHATGLQDWEQE